MEHCYTIKMLHGDLPRGPGVKNLPADMGDTGSIPGLGTFHMLQPATTPEEPAFLL